MEALKNLSPEKVINVVRAAKNQYLEKKPTLEIYKKGEADL